MAKPKRRRVRTAARAKPKAKPRPDARTEPPRPHGNRLVFSPALIADGKRRYETTPESLDSIALDFGASRSTLRNIARHENWVRYVPPPRDLPRAAALAAEAAALEALTLPPRSGGEGRLALRQQGEPGWGAFADSKTPPTPDPSPPCEARMGGGEENAAPSEHPTPAVSATPWNMRQRIEELRGAVDDELAAVRAVRAKLKRVPHSTEKAGRTSRTLADLTTTLERLHRLEIGVPQHDGLDPYDDMPADIDAFRYDLARRIRAFVASRRRPDGDAGHGEPPAPVDEV